MRCFLRSLAAVSLASLPVATWAESALPAAAPAAATHWAFQPVKKPAVPTVGDPTQVYQPLDAFVLKALNQKGLALAPKTDRATRIRRAYFALLGVPPTADEVDAFVADTEKDAYVRLIDRLLADPRFGERWGRYWLDVARYADSKGYVFQEERKYAYAWTYRDWVIKAFNDDLPYDKFILAQLAADQTLAKDDPKHFAAMGFLTLGRRFLNNEPDIIDDRLDVTFRGLQGMTIGCARCHDHKFDPVPMADYYSLYGVFASSEEPAEKPTLGEPEKSPEYDAYMAGLKKKETAVDDFHRQKKNALTAPKSVGDSLQAVSDTWGKPDGQLDELAKNRHIYPVVVRRWRDFLKKLGDQHPVAAPWLALAKVSAEKFEAEREGVLSQLMTTVQINPLVLKSLKDKAPKSMAEVNQAYAELFAANKGEAALPDPNAEAIRQVMRSPDGVMGMTTDVLSQAYFRDERNELTRLRNEVDAYKANTPGGPARGMVMMDRANPVEPHIFLRGNRANQGPAVPRQFLAVLSPQRKPFAQGSGRAELARSIASKDNPLTARVMVNRLWGWMYGQPLVDTTSDFGVRTPPAANPELLEYLAATFMEQGWSMKALVRQMALSATWQQSDANPVCEAAGQKEDPENKLCWHQNRRRRDFESFRDSLLAVSGRLDRRMGGQAVSLTEGAANRRTVYSFIDRQNLPAVFRAFDFASPDQHAPKRYQTTVPQQALFALNNPFVIEQARSLLGQPEISKAANKDEKIRQLYRRALGRNPAPEEQALASAFVENGAIGQAASAWEFGWGRLDDAGQKTQFHPLPYFGKDRWSASEQMPDPAHGWVMLTRNGGHPGNPEHAAILRWRALEKGALRVEGTLKRPADQGDGVRVRLVSSLRGVVGTWDAGPKATVSTHLDRLEVAEGETLDFIIDCKADENSDSFQYAPSLFDARSGTEVASSTEEFAGPALDPWTAYAQVLLISNELMFVD